MSNSNLDLLLLLIPALVAFVFTVSMVPVVRNIYFTTIPRYINRLFRWFDAKSNGYIAFEKTGWFNSSGHSKALSFLVAVVLLFTLFGPSLSPVLGWLTGEGLSIAERAWGAGTLLLFVALLALLGYFSKRCPGNNLRYLHIAVICLAALYILFVVPASHTEASGLPYRHALAAISSVLVIVGLFAAAAVHLLSYREFFSDQKDAVENRALARRLLEKVSIGILDDKSTGIVDPEASLSKTRSEPKHTGSRVFHSLMVVPFREPVLLLLLPACMLVIPIFQQNSVATAVVSVMASWLILANGMYYSEWSMMVTLIHRRFARGGSLVISLLVIIIGISHLLNISYIRTITNSDTWILTFYLVAGYYIAWLYDYWANRVLSAEILSLFRNKDDRHTADDWRINFTGANATRKWCLVLHGRSRLMVVPEDGSEGPMRDAVIAPEFMIALASAAEGRDKQPALDLAKAVTRLNRNLLIGLHIVFATAVIGTFSYIHNKAPEPLVANITGVMQIVPEKGSQSPKTNCEKAEDKNRLACRLYRSGKNGPVLLLAASGGGTRAALYTASVLNGLQRFNMLDQLALVSGVSGGGVALAYLAGNYSSLRDADAISSCDLEKHQGGGPWADFCRAMAAPYIQDVMEGAAELRIILGQPLGTLLAESFSRHFDRGGEKRFDQLRDGPAMILNTTLAGHPRNTSEALYRQFCPDDTSGLNDPNQRHSTCKGPVDYVPSYTVHAGSRLVFTNLQGPVRHFSSPADSFPSTWNGKVPDTHLKYIVINDGSVPLVSAAALTANFPPVFSNAGVEIDTGRPEDGVYPGTYWVTDGGAADNRGVISLLYALRVAVREMKESNIEIPEINLIVAEASAGEIDYQAGRGLAVVLGSSAPFASQLMVELVADIESITEAEMKIHYLAIPRIFVSRGGVGTHWMMPERVNLVDPSHENIRTGPKPDSVSLNKNEILQLMFALHDSPSCDSGRSKQFLSILDKDALGAGEAGLSGKELPRRSRDQWVCADTHQSKWSRMIKGFQDGGEK